MKRVVAKTTLEVSGKDDLPDTIEQQITRETSSEEGEQPPLATRPLVLIPGTQVLYDPLTGKYYRRKGC